MNIGVQLKKYRKEHGLTQKDMADKLGLKTQQAYAYYENQKSFDAETVISFSGKLGITLLDAQNNFVPHETNNLVREPETYIEKRRNDKNISKPFMVPLIPVKAQAGYVKNYNNTDYINKMETHAIVPGIDPRGTTWRYFEIEGDSMKDGLNERDMVLCNFVPDFDWREIKDNLVYVIVTEETVLIKRVVKKNADEWELKSDNKIYPKKIIKLSDILEVWKARRKIGGDLGPVKITRHYDLE